MMSSGIIKYLSILLLLLSACQPNNMATPKPVASVVPLQPSLGFSLSSPAFANEGVIPTRYGQVPFTVKLAGGSSFICNNSVESTNVSPELAWSNVPAGTASLALIMADQLQYAHPDLSPDSVFPHWLVYNLPPSTTGLLEGLSAGTVLADNSTPVEGKNGYPAPHDQGYGGPCPPKGEKHLYIFSLYALDARLDLPAGADMKTLQQAMQGHILAQAELKGYYEGR